MIIVKIKKKIIKVNKNFKRFILLPPFIKSIFSVCKKRKNYT